MYALILFIYGLSVHVFVCVCVCVLMGGSDVLILLCITSRVLILQVGIVYVTVSSGRGRETRGGRAENTKGAERKKRK